MEEATSSRLHANVRGEVQGVGFRAFVQVQARRLGIRGWVRNRRDGSVEVVAEGPRAALEVLVAAMVKGPPASSVSGIDDRWTEATGKFGDFGVRHQW